MVLCAEQWAPAAVLLPAVDQFFTEPAGQRLAHLVEQFGQLYVVIPVVLPEEHLRLKQTTKLNKQLQQKAPIRRKKEHTSVFMSGYLRPLLFPKHLVFPPSSS